MNSTITYHIDTKTEELRGFNRLSKFVLVGNSMDGFVNEQLRTFACFEEVIKSLPRIIDDLAFMVNGISAFIKFLPTTG